MLSISMTPEAVGLGDEFTLTVTVSEPVFQPPTLLLPTGEAIENVSSNGEQYTYRYTTQSEDAPSVLLSIEMFDRSGNRTFEPLVSVPIDTVAPVMTNLTWTDGLTLPTGSSRLSFAGEASSDALVTAELITRGGDRLADVFVGSTPTAAGLRFAGAIELREIELAALAAAGSVAVSITATDPVGNARNEALAPRPLDTASPETELLATPGPSPLTRSVSFEFASPSSDLADFECRLAPDAYTPCVSPWDPVLTSSGPHTAEIRARDMAGNVDSTPATHTFEIQAVWQSIDARNRVACGISTDARLWCWGDGAVATGYTASQADTPTLISGERSWRNVFVGSNMVCAMSTDEELYCWGEGPLGLGRGESVDYSRPVPLPGGPWRSIATTEGARCAIRVDGTLWCWGAGEGAGPASGSDSPFQVGTGSDWTRVDLGGGRFSSFACGLRQNGAATRAWCWGNNQSRQLGDGTTSDRIEPVEVQIPGTGPVTDWLSLSVGNDPYACGIRSVTPTAGTLWCWGGNGGGLLGLSLDTSPSEHDPVQIGTSDDWISVSAGLDRTCALRSDGSAYCWGSDEFELSFPILSGDRIRTPDAPLAVQNPGPWVSIATGDDFACGLDGTGALTCWGENTDGRLGGGVDAFEAAPLTPIRGPATWSQVATSGDVGCGISDGELHCWGSSIQRRFEFASDGSFDFDSTVPLRVGDANDWVDLSMNGSTCGVRQSPSGARTGWCFGEGAPWSVDRLEIDPVPRQVDASGSAETTWRSVQAGGGWTVGILERTAGQRTLWQWGLPPVFSGDADDAFIDLPTQLGTATDWHTVDANGGFACGIRQNPSGNTLWCWGNAFSLGLGGANTDTPEQVGVGEPYERGWLSIKGKCGIRNDGARNSLWCWDALGDLGAELADAPTEIPAPELQNFFRGEDGGCGLDLDRRLWCIGRVAGVVDAGPVFSQVELEIQWQRISLEEDTLCGVDSMGTAYCAGRNERGQRGTGNSWGPFFPEVPR
ncbi:MAG: hypothetical protein AAF654_13805 [Myxococcota bacterium]